MLNKNLRIGIASDHAGYELKQKLVDYLKETQTQVTDYGANSTESVDYPDFAQKLVGGIEHLDIDYGILICGSGIGMSICANRHKFVRAALCYNTEAAELSRKHNDANILVLGAKFSVIEDSKNMLDVFFSTEFQGGRHSRRVGKIS